MVQSELVQKNFPIFSLDEEVQGYGSLHAVYKPLFNLLEIVENPCPLHFSRSEIICFTLPRKYMTESVLECEIGQKQEVGGNLTSFQKAFYQILLILAPFCPQFQMCMELPFGNTYVQIFNSWIFLIAAIRFGFFSASKMLLWLSPVSFYFLLCVKKFQCHFSGVLGASQGKQMFSVHHL